MQEAPSGVYIQYTPRFGKSKGSFIMTIEEAKAYVDKLTTEEKLKLAEFLDMLEAKR